MPPSEIVMGTFKVSVCVHMTSTETICDAFQVKNAPSNARTRAWDVHHILNT